MQDEREGEKDLKEKQKLLSGTENMRRAVEGI